MAIVTNPSMSEHQTTLAQQELQLAGLVKLKCKSGNIGNQELEVKLPKLNVQPFNGKDALIHFVQCTAIGLHSLRHWSFL
jgi:hypothetical protein